MPSVSPGLQGEVDAADGVHLPVLARSGTVTPRSSSRARRSHLARSGGVRVCGHDRLRLDLVRHSRLHPGVELVLDRAADEREAEHHDQDRDARREQVPPCACRDRALHERVVEHARPTTLRSGRRGPGRSGSPPTGSRSPRSTCSTPGSAASRSGSTCRDITWRSPAPSALARSMNGRASTARVCARTSRAVPVHDVTRDRDRDRGLP